MSKMIDNLQHILLNGNVEEVKHLMCPVCGSKLRVGFTDIDGYKSLGVRCEKSCLRANFDGISTIPQWVSDLGDSFMTTEEGEGTTSNASLPKLSNAITPLSPALTSKYAA